jgi:hypothetical protein
MRRVQSRLLRLLALVVVLAMFGAACGDDKKSSEASKGEETPATQAPAAAATGPDSPAAQLRSDLTGLLQEHVVLAAATTGAALGGRQDEYTAAAAAVDANSEALTAAMGTVFGQQAADAFRPLWKKHIGFVVDYTTGLAMGDKTKQTKAVESLVAYTQEFGAFLNSALPALPVATVADLVKTHILSLKDVIDAQAAKDPAKAFTALRTASAHMGMIAAPLAGAIAEKFPDKVTGTASGGPADLVTTLNTAFREHVFLAAAATGAALGGRTPEFNAAAKAVDANSEAITSAVGSVFGAPAGEAFRPLWKKHIGFVVDYTTGLAAKDKAKQDKAVEALVAYTQEFGAFLNSAVPALPKDAVAELVKTHILTLKDAIDAQAAKNWAKAYTAERAAAGHMHMIANPLAGAIVKQFPDKFKA